MMTVTMMTMMITMMTMMMTMMTMMMTIITLMSVSDATTVLGTVTEGRNKGEDGRCVRGPED